MDKVIASLERQLKIEQNRPEKNQDEDYIDQLHQALHVLKFYLATIKFLKYE